MAINKTELYSSLWQNCDELRGGMDVKGIGPVEAVLLTGQK